MLNGWVILEKHIKTNIGEIPIEDYLEITAIQNGFESYEDMVNHGYGICVNEENQLN